MGYPKEEATRGNIAPRTEPQRHLASAFLDICSLQTTSARMQLPKAILEALYLSLPKTSYSLSDKHLRRCLSRASWER